MKLSLMAGLVFVVLIGLYHVFRWLRKLIRSFGDVYQSSVTPEQKFEHNLALYLLVSQDQAAQYLRGWIFSQYVSTGRHPRLMDIERLRNLGGFRSADKEARHLFPDAKHEMIGFPYTRVFFRSDWTLSGVKGYDREIETRIKEVAKRKKLTDADISYFRRFHVLSNVRPGQDGHYGGLDFPFPDERYQVLGPLSGDQLYFDQDHQLIVHMHRSTRSGQPDKYFWERPGARKTEWLQEVQVVNA